MRGKGSVSISRAQSRDLTYSLRRHFVDEFHFRNVASLPNGSLVLDLGGNRIAKRGLFDIECYDLHVVYANLSTAKLPHVQAEAEHLPFMGGKFDAVVCSELLEHVPDPTAVLSEIHRVLRSDGTLFLCVPFLNRIHGDPYDYGRYTDYYWSRTLQTFGFREISIEKQGLFWSVLAEMLRELAMAKTRRSSHAAWLDRLIGYVLGEGRRKAVEWDNRLNFLHNNSLDGFTTGFGIRAKKE
jgi:SAM-dependent methyltransferase